VAQIAVPTSASILPGSSAKARSKNPRACATYLLRSPSLIHASHALETKVHRVGMRCEFRAARLGGGRGGLEKRRSVGRYALWFCVRATVGWIPHDLNAAEHCGRCDARRLQRHDDSWPEVGVFGGHSNRRSEGGSVRSFACVQASSRPHGREAPGGARNPLLD
jgi:hypothetical protein